MNRICYAEVKGGIGNQLFQVSAAHEYAKSNGMDVMITIESWFGNQGNHPDCYRGNIFKTFKYGMAQNYHTYKENTDGSYRELLQYNDSKNLLLKGYFQSMKYNKNFFEDFVHTIELANYESGPNQVAMHIRRGDYETLSGIHKVCYTDYYVKAMELFPGKEFVIFTDDPKRIKVEFHDYRNNLKIMVSSSDFIDLSRMARFENLIISNSSFSWWASKLGVKCEKVVAPSRWFANELFSDLADDADFTTIDV